MIAHIFFSDSLWKTKIEFGYIFLCPETNL